MFEIIFAAILCVSAVAFSLRILWAEKSIPNLAAQPVKDIAWPSITIVAAARNEAASIETAVQSLLQQDYLDLRVNIVDDRSTDATPSILRELADNEPKLKITTVEALPAGWLGKCNALHHAGMQVESEWILFTDADVQMHPQTLKHAISYVDAQSADHLTLCPFCDMPTWSLNAFVATFAAFFKIHVDPSQIANPKNAAHCGIGAFNLVRTKAYQAIDGHQAIRLCTDDDLKLGRELKRAGYSQRFASGIDLIRVQWYASFAELMRGLEKNAFAGIGYKVSPLFVANILFPLIFVAPFILVFVTTGVAWWLMFVATAMVLTMSTVNAYRVTGHPLHGLFFPIGVLIFLFIIDRAVFLALWRGGVYWRDTFYPLSQLKQFT